MKNNLIHGCLVVLSSACTFGAPADAPQTASFVSNGVKIAYATRGQGPPVVLIHGWTVDYATNWERPGVSTKLAERFRVIELDVRGHGGSDKPKEENLYGKEVVEDVTRLLDHLKIRKAHIVGYSMGGTIGLNFTFQHPDRVLSLVIGGMGWQNPDEKLQGLMDQLGKLDKNAEPTALCGRSMSKLWLTQDQLKSMKTPVSVVVGDRDPIRFLYVRPLEAARPDWPVTVIKDSDHISCVTNAEFPEVLVKALSVER
ncbi:alpha/beta hydrolase [Luteolibacter ambystomatis]|uniref:Alpha/beta hydrolase n=1 Tax=Luteolibacter ambystomatis TaxID=2824561 RepID=A0A975PHD5_9BACT|nr:alpha/beta hydrolase [Luteolibacter ambystomatis]QUE53171.1 alpha/beta hydrolase [Luteolibacter ambystomatis]